MIDRQSKNPQCCSTGGFLYRFGTGGLFLRLATACYSSSSNHLQMQLTRGTGPLAFYRGPLAQFMSPVAHTHKCKKRAEKTQKTSESSAQQPARALRMKLIRILFCKLKIIRA